MPSKRRSLAEILCRRCAGDAAHNRPRGGDPDRGVEDSVVPSARWKALRARVLRDEPLYPAGAAAGRTELATQVDHVVPVRVRPDLAPYGANCQPLCSACHNLKTTAERGPRGRAPGGGRELPRARSWIEVTMKAHRGTPSAGAGGICA